MKQLKTILKQVYNNLPKGCNFSNYCFYISTDYYTELKEFKGYKIIYSDLIDGDNVYFMEYNENINE